MAVNIRLSPSVDLAARSYCERVGISLNSLVGIALDAYLQQPVARAEIAALAAVEPVPGIEARPFGVVPATRERPTLTAPPRNPDPKPVVSAKSSKADRAKLAAWHLRNASK